LVEKVNERRSSILSGVEVGWGGVTTWLRKAAKLVAAVGLLLGLLLLLRARIFRPTRRHLSSFFALLAVTEVSQVLVVAAPSFSPPHFEPGEPRRAQV